MLSLKEIVFNPTSYTFKVQSQLSERIKVFYNETLAERNKKSFDSTMANVAEIL